MYVDYQHKESSDDDASSRETLQEALDFKESDLEMNKAGKLSPSQMTHLLFRGLGPFLGLAGSAIGLGALVLGLWMAGPTAIGHITLVRYFGQYVVIGIGALFFGVVALIMKLLLSSGRIVLLIVDLTQGKATSVSGRMNTSKSEEIEDGLSTVTRQKTHKWNCVIEGEYFELTEEGFEALQDRSGSNFRAYVTPRSRFMVSLEPAGPDPTARDPFKMEYKTSY